MTPTRRILVVDDDDSGRELAATILEGAGHSAAVAKDGREAWAAIQADPPDLVLTDLVMPGMSGTELLQAVNETPEPPPVVLMTAFGTLDSAVEATKLGAYGYLAKPLTRDRLLHLVGRALEERRLQSENRRLLRELTTRNGELAQLIGESRAIREIRRLIQQLAASESTVLILGKSGTGKELCARAMHGVSRRRARPFVPVNCGGLSETLLESELFGHVRGAFTGAVASKRGLLQEADGGTLFLDEIGEMPAPLQVKLLRALEGGEVRPVGGERGARVDLRVIAATNRDLKAAVAEGQFREDLYYRINVICVTMPDLAERRDDIPLLACHFLAKSCAAAGRRPLRVAPAAMDLLQSHGWPGNVRELRNVMERAVALASGDELRPQHLPPDIRSARLPALPAWLGGATTLAAIERHAIAHALELARGNRAAAARALGISERSLYRKLDRHQLRDPR